MEPKSGQYWRHLNNGSIVKIKGSVGAVVFIYRNYTVISVSQIFLTDYEFYADNFIKYLWKRLFK